jgi:transcriptional regulator with XRE-family HTH domain
MVTKTDVRKLGMLVRRKREHGGLTLKDVADQTELKIPTISRVERGDAQDLEGSTLLALCTWLGVKPEDFRQGVAIPTPTSKSKIMHNTPDVVELYLRADKNLNKTTATALSTLFRTAYESMSKQMREKRG